MSTHAVTYWEIHCDEPGCTAKSGDYGDFSAWSDASYAIDDWTSGGDNQEIEGTDQHYCFDHRRPMCAECDNTKYLELDEPDGDLYCPICLAYERNKKK